MKTMLAASGLALLAMAASAPAGAQYRVTQGYGYDYGYGSPYGARVRSERVCQRWCPSDMTPCDPPNFKIADARCRPNAGRN